MSYVPQTGSRLGARVIDELLVLLLWVPAFGMTAFHLLSDDRLWMSWAFFAYFISVPLLYEALAVWMFGTTLGKWAFALRVVNNRDAHRKPGFWDALTRALMFRFNVFFSYAGPALALFRFDRTHWADWVARTRVVSLTPRRRPVRIRWFWGAFFVVLFLVSGWSAARGVFSGMSWDARGLSFSAQID